MKQLACELCGGSDLVKTDGVFVCQSCGTKYSVEEAKKMMVEGVVEIQGSVKIEEDVSVKQLAKVENILKNAMTTYDVGNYSEAYSLFNDVLNLDPDNSDALLYKGLSSGWSSNLINGKVFEAVNYLNVAINNEYVKEGFSENFYIFKTKGIIAVNGILLAYYKTWKKHYSEFNSVSGIRNEYHEQLQWILNSIIIILNSQNDINNFEVTKNIPQYFKSLFQLIEVGNLVINEHYELKDYNIKFLEIVFKFDFENVNELENIKKEQYELARSYLINLKWNDPYKFNTYKNYSMKFFKDTTELENAQYNYNNYIEHQSGKLQNQSTTKYKLLTGLGLIALSAIEILVAGFFSSSIYADGFVQFFSLVLVFTGFFGIWLGFVSIKSAFAKNGSKNI